MTRIVPIFVAGLVCIGCLFLEPACITHQRWNPAPTHPATVGDPASSTTDYWLAKPDTDVVTLNDFTTLFNAAEDVTRHYGFLIDRRDYRSGLLKSQPLVSKQWFEPWRRDLVTLNDLREASIHPIRRVVYFQF